VSRRRLTAAILLGLFLSALGCSSAIQPQKPQPQFHRLEPAPRPLPCRHCFEGSLRVWDFSTAAPFAQNRMAVLESNGTVVYSHGHQWAALPGVMIARGVQQDLSRDGLFQVVVAEMPDLDTDYGLSGRVLTFGCQRTEGKDRAVLKVEVSLHPGGPGQDVLFHKTYQYRSPAVPSASPFAFVEAMNELAA